MSKGWTEPVHGTNEDGRDVTVSFGTGANTGQTALSDGHVSSSDFWSSGGHDHYGSGNGANNNGTDRGAYTGRGSY